MLKQVHVENWRGVLATCLCLSVYTKPGAFAVSENLVCPDYRLNYQIVFDCNLEFE